MAIVFFSSFKISSKGFPSNPKSIANAGSVFNPFDRAVVLSGIDLYKIAINNLTTNHSKTDN